MNKNQLKGLFFIAAVVLSFFTGLLVKDIFPNSIIPTNQSDIFDLITKSLEKNYYYDIEDEAVFDAYVAQMDAIINAYATSANDPYTRLISYEASTQSTEDYIGIGVYLTFNGSIPIISSVIYDAPAYELLYPNDQIMGIKSDTELWFSALTIEEVVIALKGNSGETKVFIVESPDGILRDVSITYQTIDTHNMSSTYDEIKDIGYIEIKQFLAYQSTTNVGTAQQFKDVLTTLESYGMETLIIDLRNNPGGALSALHNQNNSELPVGIIQQLIVYDPLKPAFTMTDQEGKITSFYGSLSTPKQYTIHVLVNEQSASASEVLAAALLENGHQVYGKETYGKHVYQNTIYLTTLNDVVYQMAYTEGIWSYGDQLTIDKAPLQVTPIEQSKLFEINLLKYEHDVFIDELSASLVPFQKFLNYLYNKSVREDGYLDDASSNLILKFQRDFDLSETGTLNFETASLLHDLYLRQLNERSYDVQLMTLYDLVS
jgi:carboxyl-terminal processing protease